MKKEKEEVLNCTFSLMANPKPEQPYLSYGPARGGIFKHFRSPGIDSASPCSLAGRYNNSFLAPKDFSKIPAQAT
jgi:hypothetical protein